MTIIAREGEQMYIAKISLYDFRQFGSNGMEPGLEVHFHPGLNALVGENDSGKTAVIDAIKLVLNAQGREYVRPTEGDFHVDADGVASDEFRIECLIAQLNKNEAKNFVEFLTVEGHGKNAMITLRLYYRAWRDGHRVYHEVLAGSGTDGVRLDGKARELLRVVYLKPLRDAEREMSAGRSSRLSQILLDHSAFREREEHPVVSAFEKANQSIERYFSEDTKGKEVMGNISSSLEAFHAGDDKREASFEVPDASMKSILESLSLSVDEINPGLGELNLLFMAAELLLLKDSKDGGMRTALVEELEAHLHPQAQLRLIEFLQGEYSDNGSQTIITTHSPVLASKINLKSLILLKGGRGYDMGIGKTMLRAGDYLFLQRFLDATKANLFFARGIIMVEGDAENILIPALADVIGCPLERHGVSIVNVGSTAFLRYSGIMTRADKKSMGVPVSVVTDCDVKPYDVDEVTKERIFRDRPEDSQQAVAKKKKDYECGDVRAFVSPRWTLEYCLAMSCLRQLLLRAIYYAKKMHNSDANPLDAKKAEEADDKVKDAWERIMQHATREEQAYCIYSTMLENNGTSKLKAIVAQCLASMIRWDISNVPDGWGKERMFDLDMLGTKVDETKRVERKKRLEGDDSIRYLVDAIRHACGLEPIPETPNA